LIGRTRAEAGPGQKHRRVFHAEIRRRSVATACCLFTLLSLSCQNQTTTQDIGIVFEQTPRVLASGPHRDPQLAVRASGAIVLALVTSEERGVADLDLYLSHSGGDVFKKRLRINREPGSVMSHSEGSPVFLMGPRSRFHAFWLSDLGRGVRALRTSFSKDFLNSFEAPISVTTGERGTPAFFNAEVSDNGEILAAWLGQYPESDSIPGTAHLIVSRSQDGGSEFSPPVAVASNVCPCCRPAIVAGNDGDWIVAWRDADAENVRRIRVASSKDAGDDWEQWPQLPGPGWQINGCPHSGPTVALHQGVLHIVWYTEAEGIPALLTTSRSLDGGVFSELRSIAPEVKDANHPSLTVVGDRLFVAFQGRPPSEQDGWGKTGIFLKELRSDGEGAIVSIPSGGGTASYPVVTDLHAGRLLVGWTESSEGSNRVMGVRGRIGAAR
jgi:hypothetical protein